MEQVAKKIARLLARELKSNDQAESVMAYGLTAMIQILVMVLCLLVLSLPTGTFLEAITICLSGSLLRRYSGGAHAGSMETCTVISVIFCVVFSLAAKFLRNLPFSAITLIVSGVAVLIISLLVLYRLAPVQSPNKPIRSEKRVQKMRRGSFFTIAFFCLVFIIAFLYRQYSLCYCILFGILWQCVTMTSFGNSFTGFVDQTLNKVGFFRRR